MEEGRLHQIVSEYLPEGETYRFSSVKCSNVLCKVEPEISQPLMIKVFEEEPSFAREKAAYKILNANTVKIPDFLEEGEDGLMYWIIYKYVEGTMLGAVNLKEVNSSHRLFYNIGRNLGKVHACDTTFLYTEEEKAVDIEKRLEKFIRGACKYKEELVLKYPDHSWLFELAFNIIDASKELHPIPEDFNFVIGDFSPNNIIVNNGDLAAFIDLEYFMLGNRYHDFILMHGYFEQDGEIKTSFFEGYIECLNNDHFKFSADKIMISLLKYSLECCFIATPKTIDVAVKKLMAVVKSSFQ